MESFNRVIGQTTSPKLVLEKLQQEQRQYHEGSFEWADIQSKINHIIAQNFLEYVNR